MKKYKQKIIIWSVVTVFALAMVILCAVLIDLSQSMLNLMQHVTLDDQIRNTYVLIKSYSIGGITFFLLILLMGIVITYAGIRSWKYAELFI